MDRRTMSAGLALAALGVRPVFAQGDAPIKIVVPFPPGGATDLIARMLAERLTVSMGQRTIVENKAGAAGSIGSDYVAKSPPDGRTLLLGTTSTHGTNPVLPARTPYHPVQGFSHISLVAVSPLVFLVHPDVRATTLGEFIRDAQARPGVPFASNGMGSYNHLATELLQTMTKTRLLHVPYKGAGEVIQALAAGQVQFAAADLAGAATHMKSGRIRALAVASNRRVPGFEDLPTVAESGVPDFNVDVWYALFGPAGMRDDQVSRLHAAVSQFLAEPEVKARFTSLGTIAQPETPIQLRDRVAAENVRWGAVARSAVLE